MRTLLVLAAVAVSACGRPAQEPAPRLHEDTTPQVVRPIIVDTDASIFRPPELTAVRARIAQMVLRQHFQVFGSFPERLEQALDGRGPYPANPYLDGWGRRWLYARTEDDFELRSPGEDGIPATADDVVFTNQEIP